MTTLTDLHDELDFLQRYGMDAAYKDKQIHALPQMPVIDRVEYILARCKEQRVLNIGAASGPLHQLIKGAAASVMGVDHEPGPNTDVLIDLDDYEAITHWTLPPVDLIVFAETIEHVLLPGAVLRALRQADARLLITTPNAYALGAAQWVRRGMENVNREHCCWYTYHTLKVTLERTGWTPQAWAYYGEGPVGLNEGLIVLAM